MISLSNYKALIFDMDGTLTNNMHYHHLAWMKFIEEKELGIDAETFERDYQKAPWLKSWGVFSSLNYRRTAAGSGERKGSALPKYLRTFIATFPACMIFSRLKAKKLPIGLATMGDQNNLEMTLKQLEITSYFHSTTGGDQVKKGKPHPEIFLTAAKKLGMAQRIV